MVEARPRLPGKSWFSILVLPTSFLKAFLSPGESMTQWTKVSKGIGPFQVHPLYVNSSLSIQWETLLGQDFWFMELIIHLGRRKGGDLHLLTIFHVPDTVQYALYTYLIFNKNQGHYTWLYYTEHLPRTRH